RDAEIVDHGLNHVEMRDQDGLREISCEFVFAVVETGPEPGYSLFHVFRIELGQVKAHLHAIVQLVSLQFTDGDAAHQVGKRGLTLADENVADLHSMPAYH